MRGNLTALAAAATIATATATISFPAAAGGSGESWGPPVAGGVVAGAVISTQIARPSYPGPVVYEYALPGPTYYEYFAVPPQYYPPAPQPCWNWLGSYRLRVC
jgi:hypothetical protein